jgi:hypothetical protein
LLAQVARWPRLGQPHAQFAHLVSTQELDHALRVLLASSVAPEQLLARTVLRASILLAGLGLAIIAQWASTRMPRPPLHAPTALRAPTLHLKVRRLARDAAPVPTSQPWGLTFVMIARPARIPVPRVPLRARCVLMDLCLRWGHNHAARAQVASIAATE